MALLQQKLYSETDYYNMPEDTRAELIEGQIYYHAAPGRIHQEILSELHIAIGQYIKSKKGYVKFILHRLLLNFLMIKVQ